MVFDFPVSSFFSPGSNTGNLHFILKVPEECDPTTIFEQSQPVIENVKLVLPQYHTYAMQTALFERFGRIPPSTKPSALATFTGN